MIPHRTIFSGFRIPFIRTSPPLDLKSCLSDLKSDLSDLKSDLSTVSRKIRYLARRPKKQGIANWLEHLIQVVHTQDHTYWAIKASDSNIQWSKQALVTSKTEKNAKWRENQLFFPIDFFHGQIFFTQNDCDTPVYPCLTHCEKA